MMNLINVILNSYVKNVIWFIKLRGKSRIFAVDLLSFIFGVTFSQYFFYKVWSIFCIRYAYISISKVFWRQKDMFKKRRKQNENCNLSNTLWCSWLDQLILLWEIWYLVHYLNILKLICYYQSIGSGYFTAMI